MKIHEIDNSLLEVFFLQKTWIDTGPAADNIFAIAMLLEAGDKAETARLSTISSHETIQNILQNAKTIFSNTGKTNAQIYLESNGNRILVRTGNMNIYLL